jgi:hypothetical protein
VQRCTLIASQLARSLNALRADNQDRMLELTAIFEARRLHGVAQCGADG